MRKLKSISINFDNLIRNKPVGEIQERKLSKRIKEELLGAAEILATDEIFDNQNISLKFHDNENEVFTGFFKEDVFFVEYYEHKVLTLEEMVAEIEKDK